MNVVNSQSKEKNINVMNVSNIFYVLIALKDLIMNTNS